MNVKQDRKNPHGFSVRRVAAVTGRGQKDRDLFRFTFKSCASQVKDRRRCSPACVGGLNKKKGGGVSVSLNKDVSFPFRSECQGWRRSQHPPTPPPQPPRSPATKPPYLRGQCRCRVLFCAAVASRQGSIMAEMTQTSRVLV